MRSRVLVLWDLRVNQPDGRLVSSRQPSQPVDRSWRSDASSYLPGKSFGIHAGRPLMESLAASEVGTAHAWK